MLTHIVLWKLKEEAEGRSRLENMKLIRERIGTLPEAIPQILHMELREDIGSDRDPSHMALIMKFENKEDLTTYQAHPTHKAFSAFISKIRESRAVVDYTD